MDRQEIEARIRHFLQRFFRDHTPRVDEDIFATGYVNSMFAMQLVQFVEGEFGVLVESDDLDIENFRTIDAMIAFIERKRASPA